MNPSFYENPLQEAKRIWLDFTLFQKISLFLAVVFVLSLCIYAFYYTMMTQYIPLFASDRNLSQNDITEVRDHLDHLQVKYNMHGDVIWVAAEQAQNIRAELASYGIPKIKVPQQGFELFDSNTWIKGEKELQVLELRALKGQLEKDLTQFENVRSASVILDIAPPRPFGGTLYKTKASVILNLLPGARLTPSELRSITFHIAGAVRGLNPNMIAISDTTGRLYQGIDPDNSTDSMRNAEIALEEQLKTKIDGMLAMIMGMDNYYSSVQVLLSRDKTLEERKVYSGRVDGVSLGTPVPTSENEFSQTGFIPEKKNNSTSQILSSTIPYLGSFQEKQQQQAIPMDTVKISSGPGKIENISIAVMLDKLSLLQKVENKDLSPAGREEYLENLRKEVQNQLDTIILGYNAKVFTSVNFVNFDPNRLVIKETVELEAPAQKAVGKRALTILTITAALCLGFVFLITYLDYRRRLYRKKERKVDGDLEQKNLYSLEEISSNLEKYIHRNPREAAQFFHDWIYQEDKKNPRNP